MTEMNDPVAEPRAEHWLVLFRQLDGGAPAARHLQPRTDLDLAFPKT